MSRFLIISSQLTGFNLPFDLLFLLVDLGFKISPFEFSRDGWPTVVTELWPHLASKCSSSSPHWTLAWLLLPLSFGHSGIWEQNSHLIKGIMDSLLSITWSKGHEVFMMKVLCTYSESADPWPNIWIGSVAPSTKRSLVVTKIKISAAIMVSQMSEIVFVRCLIKPVLAFSTRCSYRYVTNIIGARFW